MDYCDHLEMDMASYRHDEYHPGSYLYDSGGSPSMVKCKHCGLRGLRWKKTSEGWRTATVEGVVHKCPAFAGRVILANAIGEARADNATSPHDKPL